MEEGEEEVTLKDAASTVLGIASSAKCDAARCYALLHSYFQHVMDEVDDCKVEFWYQSTVFHTHVQNECVTTLQDGQMATCSVIMLHRWPGLFVPGAALDHGNQTMQESVL